MMIIFKVRVPVVQRSLFTCKFKKKLDLFDLDILRKCRILSPFMCQRMTKVTNKISFENLEKEKTYRFLEFYPSIF